MKKPSGVILYQGPSLLDGAPIVVIATGLDSSSNSKTGNMIQTHIIRADMLPMDAIYNGEDSSICGDCPHRGDGTGKGRTCYVTVYQAQTAVYKAFLRGSYPVYDPAVHDKYLEGRAVRIGTYGDPTAAPIEVWHNLKTLASITTGYSHQWRTISQEWAKLVMASADTPDDVAHARQLGYRSFRVGDEKLQGEVLCPASKEAGKKLQCIDCGACGGADGRNSSIYIPLHGGTAVMSNKPRLIARIAA
jgi:hypothetical protein